MIGGSQWAESQKGIGLRYAVGGNLRAALRLSRLFDAVLTGGYGVWKIRREFRLPQTETAYNLTTTIQQIPLELGLRLRAKPGLYVSPSVGGYYTLYDYQDELTPLFSNTDRHLSYGFGGDIGYEWVGHRLVLDLSGGYNYVATNKLAGTQQAMQTARIRLGIGLH